GNLGQTLGRVLDVIFQAIDLPGGQQLRQRMHATLLGFCQDSTVTGALGACAAVLWEDPDEAWRRWAAERYKATLRGALPAACDQSCPQMEAGGLVLDHPPRARPPRAPPPPEGRAVD